jgi:sugar phosphate isomerase/epimerase
MKTRREFFKAAGTGMLAVGFASAYGSPVYAQHQGDARDLFKLGMAGYSFREFTVEQTIEMMKRVGVSYISVKDFHMPYTSTPDQIKSVISKFRTGGINVYAVGVVYMKTEQEVDRAFGYAKTAGVKLIVGAPDYALLPYVEKKVKEHDIRLAIHNHGPDNALFPNSMDIWNNIWDKDRRMGICIDIGHTKRDGKDPVSDILKYGSRIFDIHIKDVDGNTKEGKTVEIGRGIIDMPGVITALRRIGFSGMCSLEYEKDMKDPLAGIAESLGYFRGVMQCRKG